MVDGPSIHPPSAQRPGVQWPFRDLPFRVFPDDGWQILRVPEDDDDFLPPLPDQNLGAGVNQVIVVSDPRNVGEPSPDFERVQRDFFCEGPTLDWESDSDESSDESSRALEIMECGRVTGRAKARILNHSPPSSD